MRISDIRDDETRAWVVERRRELDELDAEIRSTSGDRFTSDAMAELQDRRNQLQADLAEALAEVEARQAEEDAAARAGEDEALADALNAQPLGGVSDGREEGDGGQDDGGQDDGGGGG